MYYAVTGKVPFPGGTTADKARAHRELRPLDPRRLNHALSDSFVDVLADMMAKDPAQRIPSALEVVRRLAPWANQAPQTQSSAATTPAIPLPRVPAGSAPSIPVPPPPPPAGAAPLPPGDTGAAALAHFPVIPPPVIRPPGGVPAPPPVAPPAAPQLRDTVCDLPNSPEDFVLDGHESESSLSLIVDTHRATPVAIVALLVLVPIVLTTAALLAAWLWIEGF